MRKTYETLVSRLGEMSSRPVDEAVRRYQTHAVAIAILVHAFIFVTGIITLVILQQPLHIFALTHGTIQAAAIVNAAVGPKLYRRYLIMRMRDSISLS